MLKLQNLCLMRGVRVLYKNVNLTASDGERVGLIGPNGSGKSTLFASILGELSTEDGDILAPPPIRISHVAQRIVETELQALQFVLEGHEPLMEAKKELAEAEKSGNDDRYALALAHAAEINEGAVIAQAEEIMYGLGFKPGDSDHRVSTFSGGWRNRLALARALMKPADLILLDEPTNHLDLDSVIWLENFLKHLNSSVIVISHDREFLDRISQTIWSVEDGTIARYGGNFSQYEQARSEKIKLQQAAAKAYEVAAAHLQAYIDRFRYKASKAKQAQSRIKMLEKLQKVEPLYESYEWSFRFQDPEKVPQHLISAEGLSCGYGDKTILSGVKCSVQAGARIGVLGVNGAGKSTLIKTLIGDLKPLSGEIRYGNGLIIGYFAQHQLNELRDDETPIQHLARIAPPNTREQELRNFLGAFRFSGDMATSPVGPMSGGEKARLSLALISWNKPNLLVFDEPTNHLDMATREALTNALSFYDGAVLLVSHDRHLLRACCDELWLVRDGKLSEFNGDLDDYAELVLKDKKARTTGTKEVSEATPLVNRKEQRKAEAQERIRIAALAKPIKKEIEKIEKRLEKLSAEKSGLDQKLADPLFYQGEAGEVAQCTKRHGELSAQISELEEKWLELSDQLQSIN